LYVQRKHEQEVEGRGRVWGKMQAGSARSVDNFEKLEQIGEGTYGQVRGCL